MAWAPIQHLRVHRAFVQREAAHCSTRDAEESRVEIASRPNLHCDLHASVSLVATGLRRPFGALSCFSPALTALACAPGPSDIHPVRRLGAQPGDKE